MFVAASSSIYGGTINLQHKCVLKSLNSGFGRYQLVKELAVAINSAASSLCEGIVPNRVEYIYYCKRIGIYVIHLLIIISTRVSMLCV